MSLISYSDQLDLFGVPVPEDDGPREPLAIGVWPMDCANVDGIRPCPRVTCRHHLLLDEVYSGTAPSLAINRAGALVQLRGRRPELAPDASRLEFELFAEAAVAVLWNLPDTCSREVARRYREVRPDADEAMTFPEIAAVLGVGDPDELAEEFADHRAGLRGEAIEAGGDPDVEESAVEALVRKFYAWSDEHAAAYERLATFFDCARHEVDRMIDRVLAGRGTINRGR